MEEMAEKYVAKALEGYEQNFTGISEAITQLEGQLENLNKQRNEMKEGIDEMRELMGLEAEDTLTPLTLVSDEHGNSEEE